MSIQSDFDNAYWLSQPPEIRALRDLPAGERAARAMTLAAKGFAVDVPIMIYGWDAYLVMFERSNDGYTWVPSALQAPVQVAPRLGEPGRTPYDPDNPPAGSIKVSLVLADYKPWPNPNALVPPPHPIVYIIGPQIAPAMPLYYAFDSQPDGFSVEDPGSATHPAGHYTRHRQIVGMTPFGPESNNWYSQA